MKKGLMVLMAVWFAGTDTVEAATTVRMASWTNGTEVTERVWIGYTPMDAGAVTVKIDGDVVASGRTAGSFWWTPQTIGTHTLTHAAGTNVWNLTVNVTKLDRGDTKEPEPPMEVVETITITPTERAFATKGGAGTVKTSGTGDWTAAVSDDWITLNSTAGTAGASVAYRVAANTAVEARTGYVYVAGRVFTVTQAGVGATLDRDTADINSAGGEGTVTVNAGEGAAWRAWPNADWLSVSCTEGEGTGDVTWSAAPWNERSVRTGTLTIAGQTFTVTQEGQFVWLGEERVSCDAEGREIEIVVNTLKEEIDWSVTANDDWIHVTDAGSGVGNGRVRIAVDENLGYWERTGTVTVRREVFTVTQTGTLLVNCDVTIFDQYGDMGTVTVEVDDDVEWSAEIDVDWILVWGDTSGTGCGEIEFVVDFCEEEECARTGTIRVGDKVIVISQRAGMTVGTAVPVPYSWLETYYPGVPDYEAKVKETAANGVNTVEEAYVFGLDPRDGEKTFKALIDMGENGEVTVTWDPDLNEGGKKNERVYRVWGRETLEGGDWVEVTDKARGGMRFFKVTVEMK